MNPSWIPMLTVLGIGSIAAAFIARGVAIAQLRQAWINALRDDLAEALSGVRLVHLTPQRMSPTDPLFDASLQELSDKAMASYRRVLLRLNLTERLHAGLKSDLDALFSLGGSTDREAKIASAMTTAQALLKREWQVTKYGPFVDIVGWLKGPAI